jgi:agmatine deiminase
MAENVMRKLLHYCFMATIATIAMMTTTPKAHAELIVLASPASDDPYYAEMQNDIFDFHVAYAKKIMKRDDVIILTDKKLYNDYVKALGADHVAIAPMPDIWMRDFTTANPTKPVMFRYTAAGQGKQADSDAVQEELASIAEKAGLNFVESDLFNDGGNFVDDYAGNVVVSKKFLRDNHLDEDTAREKLRALTDAKNIAFIEADEQGGLEHADGVVSFVDTNTIMINSYPEDAAYAKQLKADLQRGLPGVQIHEIVTPYDGSKVFDKRFGSACGLYTNALVTPTRIYLPQFGIEEDKIALQQVRKATTREVVPVSSARVCQMGGGVRCMSWQLRGDNAKKLQRYLATK